TPRNEPRRRAFEEIEARDLKTKGIPGLEPEQEKPAEAPAETPAEAATEPQAASEAEAPADTPDAAPAVPEAPKTVRVKVDGEEYDAPDEEVEAAGGVKAYQIQKAAENRLNKANATLSEARKVQAAIAQWVQQAQ